MAPTGGGDESTRRPGCTPSNRPAWAAGMAWQVQRGDRAGAWREPPGPRRSAGDIGASRATRLGIRRMGEGLDAAALAVAVGAVGAFVWAMR